MKTKVNKTLKEYKLKDAATLPLEVATGLSEVTKRLNDLGNRLNSDLLKYGRKSTNNVNK